MQWLSIFGLVIDIVGVAFLVLDVVKTQDSSEKLNNFVSGVTSITKILGELSVNVNKSLAIDRNRMTLMIKAIKEIIAIEMELASIDKNAPEAIEARRAIEKLEISFTPSDVDSVTKALEEKSKTAIEGLRGINFSAIVALSPSRTLVRLGAAFIFLGFSLQLVGAIGQVLAAPIPVA